MLRVGTSGWNYPHWKGIFYPEDLPKDKWLDFYMRHFDTVEVNSTFYRLPQKKAVEAWYKKSYPGFVYSIKMNRTVTHIKRLKNAEEELERFFELISALKERCGIILIQLPPNLKFDRDLFEKFCSFLNPSYRYALEVRNRSWIDEEAFRIMRRHGIAFCISDTAGKYPYFEEITADFVYIRLHGSKILYRSLYTEEEIKRWAEKIRKWKRETYVYFDNDFCGYAVKNAKMLKDAFSSDSFL